MAISNLYLSHQSYDWSILAKAKKQFIFLNKKNVYNIIESIEDTECYTSIEDIRLDQFEKICASAKKIYLIDINTESLSKIDNLYSYILCIQQLSNNKIFKDKTIGLNFKTKILGNINSLHNVRKHDSAVLWVAGCSITAGSGVNDNQRFGYHLANELDLPEILLAKPGASIFWAADQILRSDVRKGDMVIWGLTSSARVDVAKHFELNSFPISTYLNLPIDEQYWNIDYFDSLTQIVTNLRCISQVNNYCEKIGASLYLVNLLDPTWADLAFSDKINYINLTSTTNFQTNKFNYIDLGTDNDHPGPQQHQEYAKQILKFIKEKNHGN